MNHKRNFKRRQASSSPAFAHDTNLHSSNLTDTNLPNAKASDTSLGEWRVWDGVRRQEQEQEEQVTNKVQMLWCEEIRPEVCTDHHSPKPGTEALIHTAMMLKEAVIKCDEILRYQQLIALNQSQEDEMEIERLQKRKTIARVTKEVH